MACHHSRPDRWRHHHRRGRHRSRPQPRRVLVAGTSRVGDARYRGEAGGQAAGQPLDRRVVSVAGVRVGVGRVRQGTGELYVPVGRCWACGYDLTGT